MNKRITDFRIIRNKFAHFCWSRQSDEKIFGTNFSGKIPKNNKRNKDSIVITVDELNDRYREAYNIVEELQNIIDKLPEIKEDNLIRLFS